MRLLRRPVAALVVAMVLFGIALAAQERLRSIPREDPLGKELLYLPTPEMLRLLSLGNEGLMADLMFIWAVQYYSGFQPSERFLYLEKVFDLITDLDPRFYDAYRIGALIMQMQKAQEADRRYAAITELYDKGVANMPEDWLLPFEAAWDMVIEFNDLEAAIRYGDIAAQRPDAPQEILRMAGVWRRRLGTWTIHDSIVYWYRAFLVAERVSDRVFTARHFYGAVEKYDRQRLEPLLEEFRESTDVCPESWQDVVQAGLIDEIPRDLMGRAYGVGPDCELEAYERIDFGDPPELADLNLPEFL